MCEVGVWKNFGDLEDSLTLEELSELYISSMKRQSRLMKMVAASMGAEVDLDDDDDDEYDSRSTNEFGLPNPDSDSTIIDQYDIQALPFGLGYDTMV